MNELTELRKDMLEHYDNLSSLYIDPSQYTEGYLAGLRTAIQIVVQKIEETNNENTF